MTVQENTALLIIDVINKMDFEGAEQLLQQTLPVLEPLSKLKQHCKRQNIPVIYVNDNFGLWQENVNQIIDECRGGLGDMREYAIHVPADCTAAETAVAKDHALEILSSTLSLDCSSSLSLMKGE